MTPIFNVQIFSHFDCLFYREANFKSITPLLEGLQTLWEVWNDEEITYRVRDILIVSHSQNQRNILQNLQYTHIVSLTQSGNY